MRAVDVGVPADVDVPADVGERAGRDRAAA